MSYGNNNDRDNYESITSTGLGNSNQYGQRQGQSIDDQNVGNQPYGQSNIGGNQGSNWSSGNTDTSQLGSSGHDQLGSSTGRDNLGSSGSDTYGSNTGIGGTGSGIGSTGDSYGSDSRNQGLGYGSDQSSGIGQQHSQKPSVGDKMRGGFEKGIGKVTGQPDLVEKGQERATGQFDGRRNL
ncbi:hypothetical protein H2248_007149 [Termitomyces sp. 'cryptogamus']|nr:hypothetical protein H2248_007149 [Termitomyces sp. 'cryptogamus']